MNTFLDTSDVIFTKSDAFLVDRHQEDVNRLAKHNQLTHKAVEDEKERRRKAQITQENMAKDRRILEGTVMDSGEAVRKLEACVDKDLMKDASQAAVDARHAAAECRQVEGYVATCALSLERLVKPGTAAKQPGGTPLPTGIDDNVVKGAQERLVRAQKDLEEHKERVQRATEKSLAFDLKIAKAKEEILARARGTA